MIPDHAFRVARNPNDPDNQIWRRGDGASLAVGQGDVLVTPLQLANAYATFANGGTLYAAAARRAVTESARGLPRVSLGTPVDALDAEGNGHHGPHARGAQPDDDRVSPGVDRQRDGTAAGAFSNYQGMPVIGKTGTAEVVGEAGHVVVRGDHQPRQPRPRCSAVRVVVDGRARAVRCRRRRPDRAARIGSSTTRTGSRRRSSAHPPSGTSRALMATMNANRIARAHSRRGLGERSRFDASPLRHFDWLLVIALFAISGSGC